MTPTRSWTPALALALLLLAATARAQSLNAQGVQRLNEETQALWVQDGLPMARAQALVALQKLVGAPQRVNAKTTATITRVRSITIDGPRAPGVARLDGTGVDLRIPLAGEWRVAASVDVHVVGRLLGIKVDRTIGVDVELSEVRAAIQVDLDSSDPLAPRIVRMHPAQVHFRLKVHASTWWMNALLWLTRGTVNEVASATAWVGARYVAARFNAAPQGNPQVILAGTPALAPVAPADLRGAAERLEDDVFATKMPHGSVWEVRYDRPYAGTWEDSVKDPTFSPGVVLGYQSAGDSALVTGDQLAALAHRWAVTHEPGTLRRIRQVLATTRLLLTMKGEPGNLNRTLMPASSPFAPQALGADQYVQAYQGTDWIMSDYISRDAYKGMCFGLSLCYDLVDVPVVRDEARQQVEWAIDYLLRNGWTWRKRDGSFGERWTGTLEQQWAWVLAAARVNPTKYAPTLAAHQGYADLLWLGVWGGCLDPYYSYYKFNLAHGALHVVLQLETDPVRWQRAYQGLAIMRHFIGHHDNGMFKAHYLAFDPASRAALGAEEENLLTRWLRRPRRYMIPDVTNDPTIAKTTYHVPFDPNLLFPGQGVPQDVLVSTHPVDVEKRPSTGDIWSVSPYHLTGPLGAPDPYAEPESMDFLLPYWVSRYHGAVP